jgi:hypothetical protein
MRVTVGAVAAPAVRAPVKAATAKHKTTQVRLIDFANLINRPSIVLHKNQPIVQNPDCRLRQEISKARRAQIVTSTNASYEREFHRGD